MRKLGFACSHGGNKGLSVISKIYLSLAPGGRGGYGSREVGGFRRGIRRGKGKGKRY